MRTQRHLLLQLMIMLVGVLLGSALFAQDADLSAKSSTSTSKKSSKTTNERAELELLLSGYHGLPSKKVLAEKLSEPQKQLRAVAADPHALPLQRQRAVEALGYFADQSVENFYLELIKDESTDEMLRHRTMPLLAKYFPKLALPYLEPFLSHDDLQFRLSAIDAIRRIPGNDSVDALRRALKTEANPLAREKLTSYTRQVR